MTTKRIDVEQIGDEIEILADRQRGLIAHDLAEIAKAAEGSGYAVHAETNIAVLVRAQAIESNAMILALMMKNPRGYLQDVECYEITDD